VLSYQHAYHAGNAADLHKHIVLAELLDRLAAKRRPLTYMETHAGRGRYDLASPEALKTAEAAGGIGRLTPDPATPFGRALAAARAAHGATAYPGSPLIAATLLRHGDRIVLMERHPAEHAALRRALPAAEIHHRDGFEGALALAPPKPRRGLLLVDPSYEVKSDYATVAAFALRLIAKWPEAVLLVWYPLLAAGRHQSLSHGLAPLRPLVDEVAIVGATGGMAGSGLAIVNPPFGAEAAFAAAHAATDGILRPAVAQTRRRR
jgi:23S rRNA (adenine2030-N6)-methyltransferase